MLNSKFRVCPPTPTWSNIKILHIGVAFNYSMKFPSDHGVPTVSKSEIDSPHEPYISPRSDVSLAAFKFYILFFLPLFSPPSSSL